ncbi:adenosylcobinamide-phosphate synthase CbiB [uncultured Desulfovibrio sp.]|uniref:adenosylcobinamide-phosphate synthase CbiB n=1 Tax=uncultured Desulfovibrio sp. TaxID=167968 RepID=UPI00261CD1AE|nr:adenosylcobinamide-phosphate synthase CbiB [uncultured Desulfovibrio sp.]
MSLSSAVFLLPAALLLDRLCGEPPARVHPVCALGALAARLESRLRRGPNGLRLRLAGLLACLALVLCAALCAALPVLLAGALAGDAAAWLVCVVAVSLCLAPRCLDEHARRVALPLEAGDLTGARRAVSMLVGRDPQQLDAHGVARACVESVGENLTDGVLGTLFWAATGLLLAGLPGAAALAACHRAANVLDALWGKLDETYRCFGTAAARLDDLLNWCPARLALPCIALAAALLPGLDGRGAWRTGWRYRRAHESPNSAWSEAAFAGALGLRLGGPAWYGPLYRRHPWLGDGSPLATARHIRQAVRLMWASLLVFAALASLLVFAALAASV